MSPTGERNEETGRSKADGRREEIVERAAQLIDRQGYDGTTLDDIAGEVGLRKATLYHYFGSKDEILNTIHEDLLSWTLSREVARRKYDLSPEHHLLEIIADTLEIIAARPGHVRVFVEHYRELPPEERAAIAEKRDNYTGMVEEVFREGVEAGEFRPVDPGLAVLALFGVTNWAYQWMRVESPDETREVAYSLWRILMDGIAADRDNVPGITDAPA